MLKSLLGERGGAAKPAEGDFAATAILETGSSDTGARAAVDRHVKELLVTGAPGQAFRAHLATARDEGVPMGRSIALFDPSRMWAAGVVKALSDASGQPIERLHLRDQVTQAEIATIERTSLTRRMDDTLKVCFADVLSSEAGTADVPVALMERADLAAVIVGPMEPMQIDRMLVFLRGASYAHSWRCTRLLFLLPVGAQWIANKVSAVNWPNALQVHTLSEPLTSASAVWNALLAHWNRVKPTDDGAAALERATGWGEGDFPIKVSDFTPLAGEPASTASVSLTPPVAERAAPIHARAVPDAGIAEKVLGEIAHIEGVLFTALVDSTSGHPQASDGQYVIDVERAAAAAANVLRGHRNGLRDMGHANANEHVDEVVVTAGNRYHVIRVIQAHPDFFILTVLDKLRSNVSMARFRLMEAQQRFI